MGWTRRTAMKAQGMTWPTATAWVSELANDVIERESARAAGDAEDARTPRRNFGDRTGRALGPDEPGEPAGPDVRGV